MLDVFVFETNSETHILGQRSIECRTELRTNEGGPYRY